MRISRKPCSSRRRTRPLSKRVQAQVRAAGADAIIDIDERRSRINETLVLHVTGTGVRYTAP
ncbi:MAG: hypothetical protein ABI885_16510 [Gammaproteobacteria bacterium]